MRPSEVIMVLLEEVDEVLTEVWLQMCSDLHLMVWQVEMDGNLIEFLHDKLVQIRVAYWSRLWLL